MPKSETRFQMTLVIKNLLSFGTRINYVIYKSLYGIIRVC